MPPAKRVSRRTQASYAVVSLEGLGALLDDRDADHGGLLYRESAKESRVQIGGK